MKKSLQSTFLALLFIAVIGVVTSCKHTNATLPIPVPIVNPIISQITATTAIVGGRIGAANYITENGICYSSTNKTPTTSDTFISDTIGVRWSNKIVGLTPNTTYYLRAYASSDSGTGYSDVLTFKTGATNAVPVGTVTTFAGSATGTSGYADATGTAALFDGPQSISYNPLTGLLYVSDSFNNAIRTVSTAGITRTLNGNTALGLTDGPLASSLFYGPKGFSFDAQGNTYVADIGNNVVRKITPAGVVSTLAGSAVPGYANGTGTAAKFYNPQATVTDAAGNVYVADRSNNLIRKITPAGVVSVLAGFLALNGYPQYSVPGYADGDSGASLFNYPAALTIDATGNIYVADYKNKAIRKVTPAGAVTTYAGGLGFPDLIGQPTGLVIDAQGNLFIADNNGRILEITASKVMYVLAGATNATGFVNGIGTAARFSSPQSLTIDSQGNLYVTDFNNNVIRKITVAVQ